METQHVFDIEDFILELKHRQYALHDDIYHLMMNGLLCSIK